MPIGFRVHPRGPRLSADNLARFGDVAVAHASDAMGRMRHGGTSLRPYHAGGRLIGPAVTVLARPGDNLMLHKAMNIAEPGDVIVVDAGGDLTNALFGEIMLGYARLRGFGGIVINGAIRDSAVIGAGPFPVYAAGVTHRGPYKDGPGEINVPIAIGGMVVAPGDLMLGDEDGLVAVPHDSLDEVFATVTGIRKKEAELLAEIASGEVDRSWVDAILKRQGCDEA
ncbi:RraA family protein [Bosea sp. RAF48]|jgi:regulator of RNase E activity RraA|uniref:RraA family protein n=1 Tax=Bosea sp. RAF48 TaxID=3237480 RepID=UPI003F92F612